MDNEDTGSFGEGGFGGAMRAGIYSDAPAGGGGGVPEPVVAEAPKKRRLGIMIGVLVAVLVIVGVILGIKIKNDTENTARLKLAVIPNAAVVEIDGKEYMNGEYAMRPGDVVATVKMPGMVEQEFKLSLVEGETTELMAWLFGEDDVFSYYDTHYDDRYNLIRYFYEETELGQTAYDLIQAYGEGGVEREMMRELVQENEYWPYDEMLYEYVYDLE